MFAYLYRMLSNSQQKLIRALQQKKQRDREHLFVLEGDKIITDLMASKELTPENTLLIAASEVWAEGRLTGDNELVAKLEITPPEILKKISSLQTPPEALAVVRIPDRTFDPPQLKKEITLAFDRIRDPGNLGTVIRTADWFGAMHIICSTDSVDQYNSKVVQASMGSILRVQTHYMDLEELFFNASRLKVPVYGTTMDGEDLYETPVKNPSVILFGNESSGIDPRYEKTFKAKLRIPDHPPGRSGSESLNVASSVAVICSEMRRRDRLYSK